MHEVGTEPEHRSGGHLDDDLGRRLERGRVRQEPGRVVRVSARRTEPVRTGQHPHGAVLGGGVVEEHDGGDDVRCVPADSDVPVRVVLVPGERAAFPRPFQVELRRERRDLTHPERLGRRTGEARVGEQGVDPGMEMVDGFQQADLLAPLGPFPLDRGLRRELDAVPVSQLPLRARAGANGSRRDARRHFLHDVAQLLDLAGVENALLGPVARLAEGRHPGSSSTRSSPLPTSRIACPFAGCCTGKRSSPSSTFVRWGHDQRARRGSAG